ncbi:hypothetical protein BSZ39_10950 [Bowdeniella nasicola]|uniref:DUF2254 domain-containing protein n=1 Tax=Bowdeniella nasicola TaxID=208480 RepID=A0A1Q5Q097_9ACTO|nr:hypothetical protein BSZ39_10950 [Bowdeniella nasicola]
MRPWWRRCGHDPRPQEAPAIPHSAEPVRATDSGHVRFVATERAATWAKERDAIVIIAVAPGDAVITGQVVAWVFARGGRLPEDLELPTWCVSVDHERVSDADIRLGMHQLSDIAVRALSPGTNDPTTAVHAVNQAISIARTVAKYPLNGEWVADDDGIIRAYAPVPTPVDFLQEIVGPVRRYASAEPFVLIQLLRLLAVVEEVNEDAEIQDVIEGERRRIVESAEELAHKDDAAWVREMAQPGAIQRASRVAGPQTDIVEDDDEQAERENT